MTSLWLFLEFLKMCHALYIHIGYLHYLQLYNCTNVTVSNESVDSFLMYMIFQTNVWHSNFWMKTHYGGTYVQEIIIYIPIFVVRGYSTYCI